MAVSRKELREYFEPALRRKTFRFHQLRGLVDDGTLQGLRFAKVFSRPDKSRLRRAFAHADPAQLSQSFAKSGQAGFEEAYAGHGGIPPSRMPVRNLISSFGAHRAGGIAGKRNDGHDLFRELSKAGLPLRAPVLGILEDMMKSAGPDGVPDSVRLDAMAKIRGILLECGVHAFFSRPSSAGLMLHWREAGGLPLHLYLGESVGHIIGQGKLNLGPDGRGSIEIDITQNASRMMQMLDYWLADMQAGGNRLNPFKLRMVRIPREKMPGYASRVIKNASLSEEEIPVLFALEISCLRLAMERFDSIAAESPSARHFLMRALNLHVDSTLAHEVAHLEEGRATGSIPVHPMVREAFAYFLQAIHADPGDAFSSMLSRGFDITAVMPSFDSALRALGPQVFYVDGGFLRGWAKGMLDAILDRCVEMGVLKERPNPEPIRNAQTTDFITEKDMPCIERALCNPNRRSVSADIVLGNAEPL